MSNQVHVMFDIETLDTAVSTAFLSVGAVAFRSSDIDLGLKSYQVFNIDDQLKRGRTVSGRTIAWWIEQGREAQQVIGESAQSGLTLEAGLTTIRGFIDGVREESNEILVWGNGADFDIAILEHAFRMSGVEVPWFYYNVRCYRTLRNLFPHIEAPTVPGAVRHNALDDAIVQARHAQLILQEIERCSPRSSVLQDALVQARTL